VLAAKAALVALMQNSRSTAAIISMVNLMADPPVCLSRPFDIGHHVLRI
jgi:hypothetical protein